MLHTKNHNSIFARLFRCLIILISLSPLLFLVFNSLKSTRDYLLFPFSFPKVSPLKIIIITYFSLTDFTIG